jgi:hypothetical protein
VQSRACLVERLKYGIAMTQPSRVPMPRPQFDEFLYAPVLQEANGMPLTVLSALARLNIDPWDEAQRLAKLPREAAALALSAVIAALPNGPAAGPNAQAIVARLTALLPAGVAAGERSPDRARAAETKNNVHAMLTYYLIGMALYLGVTWLLGPPTPAIPPPNVASPAAIASSPQAPAPSSASETPGRRD